MGTDCKSVIRRFESDLGLSDFPTKSGDSAGTTQKADNPKLPDSTLTNGVSGCGAVVAEECGALVGSDCLDQWPIYRLNIGHFSPCVYILLLRGRVVYVGQTQAPLGRFYTHLRNYAGYFDEIQYAPMPAESLLRMERWLINTLLPVINGRPDHIWKAILHPHRKESSMPRDSPPAV